MSPGNRRSGINLRVAILIAFAALVLASAAMASPQRADAPITAQAGDDDIATLLEIAEKAYEREMCPQVIAQLREVEARAPERVDGVSYYRWGYCSAKQKQPDAEKYYLEARKRLDEAASSPDARLDTHFYRVNSLVNLELEEDARNAAKEAVSRWEKGTLVVPAEDPEAWFRLGKLFRDAGDPKGAAEPFSRALGLVEQGGHTLRAAYIERIARGAVDAGDGELGARATALLKDSSSEGPEELLRLGRVEVGAGKLDEARQTFQRARAAGGDAGMQAQYSMEAVKRGQEVRKKGLEPTTSLADGRPLADLDRGELRSEIAALIGPIGEALQGAAIEVPRRSGKGTKPAPAPDVAKRLSELQAQLSGLLLESVRRGAPLREWAVSGGFAHLVHNELTKIFVAERRKQRAEESAKAPDKP